MDLDRRSFLKGALATGTLAAGGALVAGAPVAAVAADATGNRNWSWDTPPAPIPDSDIKETIETEIVVVGAGISGCACACRASQLGTKVVVLEKMEKPSSRGGHIGAYQTHSMDRYGMTNDPMDQIAAEWMRFAANRCKQKIVYRFLEESSRVMNWLEDYSEEFSEGALNIVPITTHYVGPYFYEHIGTHTIGGPQGGYPGNEFRLGAAVYFMWQMAMEKGAEFIFETPARQLVMDGNKVIGVIAEGSNGYIKVLASKGVLLASGDISGDDEMMDAYADTACLACDNKSYTPVGANTGDGQKMAMWAGAHMWLGERSSASMMHLIRYFGYAFGFMSVNAQGRRFMNEDTWIQARSLHILRQPGENRYAWSVFDADFEDQVVESIQYGGGQFWDNMSHRAGDPFIWGAPDQPGTALATFEAGLANGNHVMADTIEDLAKQMEVDPAVLQEEVDKYNASYDAGVDTDWHKRKELLTPIRTPPFHALKYGPSILTVPNGVEVDEMMRVLDKDLEPIPGLYASGNASGGRYGVDYPVVMNGNSHGSAMTFGFLVGEQLSEA